MGPSVEPAPDETSMDRHQDREVQRAEADKKVAEEEDAAHT